jgi:hypothetical protein
MGLLLQTQSVEAVDSDGVGFFCTALLISIFAAVILAVFLEVRAIRKWSAEVKYAAADLDRKLQEFSSELQEHIIEAKDLKLGKVIGEGSEGIVRTAEYKGMEVAVKITSVTSVSDAPIKARLMEAQAEAQTLIHLRHANIVSVYGVAIDHSSVEIKVMTVLVLCTKGSLADRISDAAIEMNWEEKMVLCSDIALGLKVSIQRI